MKRELYRLGDAIFGKQGIVYALLTAQLALLLEYYLIVVSPGELLVLIALHLTFPLTVFLYAKRQALEDGFIGKIEEKSEQVVNRDITDYGKE